MYGGDIMDVLHLWSHIYLNLLYLNSIISLRYLIVND